MILKCESVFLSILVTKIDVISCIVKLANYTVKLAKVILKFAHVFWHSLGVTNTIYIARFQVNIARKQFKIAI